MKYFRKLVGKKCYLSPFNPEDAERYAAWLNDMEVVQNLTLVQKVISLAAEREKLEELSRKGHHYAIVESASDEPIGGCGFVNLDPVDATAEVGIFIGDKERWGRGYGEEALRLLLDYGFNILNLRNIMLRVASFNLRAQRCYRKLGFREIGRRRKARLIHGRSHDVVYMDILAEEFSASSLPPLPQQE